MKKNIGITLLSSAVLLVFPFTVLAAFDLSTTINVLSDTLFGIALALSVVMFIWAAFLFMTAKVDLAKKVVIWAIVGLVVVILASSVYGILQSLLGAGGTSGGTGGASGGGCGSCTSSQTCESGVCVEMGGGPG